MIEKKSIINLVRGAPLPKILLNGRTTDPSIPGCSQGELFNAHQRISVLTIPSTTFVPNPEFITKTSILSFHGFLDTAAETPRLIPPQTYYHFGLHPRRPPTGSHILLDLLANHRHRSPLRQPTSPMIADTSLQSTFIALSDQLGTHLTRVS